MKKIGVRPGESVLVTGQDSLRGQGIASKGEPQRIRAFRQAVTRIVMSTAEYVHYTLGDEAEDDSTLTSRRGKEFVVLVQEGRRIHIAPDKASGIIYREACETFGRISSLALDADQQAIHARRFLELVQETDKTITGERVWPPTD